MSVTGSLNHIDISVGYPDRSIPFYAAFLEALGYRRRDIDDPQWSGPSPRRATWSIALPEGAFAIELRPARLESRDRAYDRYAPGPHHMAFSAADRAAVQRVHDAVCAIGATVLDPPTDYSGRHGYSNGYFAFFVADPDGQKLEVAHVPRDLP